MSTLREGSDFSLKSLKRTKASHDLSQMLVRTCPCFQDNPDVLIAVASNILIGEIRKCFAVCASRGPGDDCNHVRQPMGRCQIQGTVGHKKSGAITVIVLPANVSKICGYQTIVDLSAHTQPLSAAVRTGLLKQCDALSSAL